MYFTLNPTLYYAANKESIENYIVIESNGEAPYLMAYKRLKSIVESYIKLNSQCVDENKINDYIVYICDQLTV